MPRRGGLGLVIVDYLQLMRPEDPRHNRVEQVAQIGQGLKILARELDVPVLGISQLSRAPEQPDPTRRKRPILSDLRESRQIEQDSDLVGFIYRDEYYNREDSDDPGVAELIIAKHRNGPTGTVRLAFLEHYPSFANLSRQERPVEQSPGEGRRSWTPPRRADPCPAWRPPKPSTARVRSAPATAPAGSSAPRTSPARANAGSAACRAPAHAGSPR